MDYGFKSTTRGRALIAKCAALEQPFNLTRVAVGSGRVSEGTNLADVHELIHYVADGTVGDRRHKENRFCFTVQYSNEENKNVGTFNLAEFIVYAKDPESGEDVDLLYATLGDYQQPVPAYSPEWPPSVWNFPVTLVISDEIEVNITAPAGLVTYAELQQAVEEARDELKEELKEVSSNLASVIIKDIVIPVEAWAETDEAGKYKFVANLPDKDALYAHFPTLALDIPSLEIASAAGACPTMETQDGLLRFWAKRKPTADLIGTLQLRAQSAVSAGVSGGVATDEEASDAAEEVFGAAGTVVPNQAVIAADSEVANEVNGIFGV